MITQIDFQILDFIRENLRCGFLDFVMPIITHLGDAVSVIALAVILIAFKKTRKTGIMVGVALLIGVVVCNMTIKPLVARIRPYDIKTSIDLLIKAPTDYSFPSGHTIASFEAATVIFLNNKKWGIPALITAAIVAFSRLYLYVHYPSDVLFALVAGIAFAFLARFIVNKAYDVYFKRKAAKS